MFQIKKFLFFASTFLMICCASNPYHDTEKSNEKQLKAFKKTLSNKDKINFGLTNSDWISTVNFNLRKPNFVIIHHTAQDSLQQTIRTFILEKTQVSSHYVIADNGKVVQMLNDYLRAWHAGNASWGNTTDINSISIGIELDNDGLEPFSDAQIDSLIQLLTRLKKLYNIPIQNFIGHADIAPSRKNDPSALFPWKKLSENGFGIWYDNVLIDAPFGFDAILGLRIIGYNTKNLPEAIVVFKRHFIPTEINDIIDDKAKNIIYNLYQKI